MAFAKLAFRESLRDIEDCLSARSDQRLAHLRESGGAPDQNGFCFAADTSFWRTVKVSDATIFVPGRLTSRGGEGLGFKTLKTLSRQAVKEWVSLRIFLMNN